MREQLEMILTRDELMRVRMDGKVLYVDLHGLKVAEAKRLLLNIMAVNRAGYDICAIHGYHHGTAIKEMIQTRLYNQGMVRREVVKNNLGRTFLKFS